MFLCPERPIATRLAQRCTQVGGSLTALNSRIDGILPEAVCESIFCPQPLYFLSGKPQLNH